MDSGLNWLIRQKEMQLFSLRAFMFTMGFLGGSDGTESACNAVDTGSMPESGRSPGEGNGYPLQYFCLENSWTEKPGGQVSMGSQTVRHD